MTVEPEDSPEVEYDYRFTSGDAEYEAEAHVDGNNAFVRWRGDGSEGEHGRLSGDRLILNFKAYVVGEAEARYVELPPDVAESLAEDVEAREREILASLDDEDREKVDDERQVYLRAREILESSDVPEPSEYDAYVVDDERAGEVELHVEPHNGVAEIHVDSDAAVGYAPTYDFEEGVLTLPANEWGLTGEVELPERVGLGLLADLRELQQELNERRRAYDDAVEQAREEVLEE
ncbi:MAG: hypothetical protein ACLFMT_00835 [Halobacteriales archaeon]